jgi:peroxiredoxin
MPAPLFTAQAIGGRRIDLAALRGRTVLLKFYRFATCPVCHLHLHGFIQVYKPLVAIGLTSIVIYYSPADMVDATAVAGLPFDLVPDPDKRIFRAFGVEQRWAGMFAPAVWRDYARALAAGFPPGMLTSDGGITGQPADFLIDAQGIVAFAHYGRHYADSLTAAELADARRRLGSHHTRVA